MTSTTVEVNGTESDVLPLSLQTVTNDFSYNDGEFHAPVQELIPIIPVHDDSVPIVATSDYEQNKENNKSLPVHDELVPIEGGLCSSIVVATSDYEQNKENNNKSVSVTSERGDVTHVRRSPRLLSVPSCSQFEGSKLKRVNNKCVEVRMGPAGSDNKKPSKRKRELGFVGEPVLEHEARERWGWRYELKGQRRKGQSGILNAGEEDEVHVNVECHYLQANVNGCIFSLGDCAHIKGEGKQPHVGRIVEFFRTTDDENYFRVQWFFRAEDTVMQKAAAFHDKTRIFFSTLMNDNLLECLLSKVNVIEKATMLGFRPTSIQPSEYYCDMEYSVKYSTFRSLAPGKGNVLAVITCLSFTTCFLIKSSWHQKEHLNKHNL